jgi:hypothetical protein
MVPGMETRELCQPVAKWQGGPPAGEDEVTDISERCSIVSPGRVLGIAPAQSVSARCLSGGALACQCLGFSRTLRLAASVT